MASQVNVEDGSEASSVSTESSPNIENILIGGRTTRRRGRPPNLEPEQILDPIASPRDRGFNTSFFDEDIDHAYEASIIFEIQEEQGEQGDSQQGTGGNANAVTGRNVTGRNAAIGRNANDRSGGDTGRNDVNEGTRRRNATSEGTRRNATSTGRSATTDTAGGNANDRSEGVGIGGNDGAGNNEHQDPIGEDDPTEVEDADLSAGSPSMTSTIETSDSYDPLSRMDKKLHTVLRYALKFKKGMTPKHEVIQGFEHEGIFSWEQFLDYDPSHLETLTKHTLRGNRAPLSSHTLNMVKTLFKMIHTVAQTDPTSAFRSSYYTRERVRSFFANERSSRLHRTFENVHENVSSNRASDYNNHSHQGKGKQWKSPSEKALEAWNRRAPDHTKFEVLRDDTKYLPWREKFLLLLRDLDLAYMFDSKFDPKQITKMYPKKLYTKHNIFLWLSLRHALQTPNAAIILNDFADPVLPDARNAFIRIDLLLTKGPIQEEAMQTASDNLRNLIIDTFKGTRTSFIKEWFSHLRAFNQTLTVGRHMDYLLVRSTIRRATESDTELSRVYDDKNPHVSSDSTLAILHLKSLLTQRANLLDAKDRVKQGAKHRALNLHETSSDDQSLFQDFLAYKARRKLNPSAMIPPQAYTKLSKEHKSEWNSISEECRSAILTELSSLSNSTSRVKTQAYQHESEGHQDPDGFELIPNKDNTQDEFIAMRHQLDSLSASFSAFANKQKPSPSSPPPPANSTTKRSINKTNVKFDRRPLKSELGPAHPAVIMSDDNNREIRKASNNYQVFKHHMCLESQPSTDTKPIASTVEYSVSKGRRTLERSLVDRGANGGIAGGDCVIISQPIPSRYVDCTGIDDHQITGLPIKTVGAYVESQRGGVICVFNEMAYTGQHTTILSAIQLEDYGVMVDDKASNLNGTQMLVTPDGFAFPLAISNGLPYLQMRPYTRKEYRDLPHVIMTSEAIWNPRKYDTDIDMLLFKQQHPLDVHLLPNKDYNMKGQFIGSYYTDIDYIEKPKAKFWLSESEFQHQETISRCMYPTIQQETPTEINTEVNPRSHTPSDIDFEEMKPYFAWIPTKLIKKTFENSTRYGSLSVSPDGNLFKRFQSPNPAMNVYRLNDDLLTDKIYSNTPSLEGAFTAAQLFIGRKSHIAHVEPISSKKTFLIALQGFVNKWGAPNRLIGDSAPNHYSNQVIDYLRMLWIGIWTSEPYYQHQNPFERRYQTIKRIINRTMDRTGTPPSLWLLCTEYVIQIYNRVSDPTLNYRQPSFLASGQVADISNIIVFHWLEPVYFKLHDNTFPDSSEGLAYFVGFSDTIGHAMTFKIWNKTTNRILHRSSIRSAADSNKSNLRADLQLNRKNGETNDDYDGVVIDVGDDSNLTRDKDVQFSNFNSVTHDDGENDDISKLYVFRKGDKVYENTPLSEACYFMETKTADDEEQKNSYSVSFDADGTQLVVKMDLDGNPEYDTSGNYVMIPGKSPDQLQGITFKRKFDDGTAKRCIVLHPIENNLKSTDGNKILKDFKIKYDIDQVEDTIAYNEIMNYLHRDELEEDGQIWSYRKILSHSGPFSNKDKEWKGSSYNVLVEWENGDITEMQHGWMIKENEIPMTHYAIENNLLDTPGWKILKRVARREKLLTRLTNQAKLRSFRTSPKYMYGYQVPRNYQEAMAFDKKNHNTRWSDCTALEMKQLWDYDTFIDKGPYTKASIPPGFKKIKVHLVYAVKHDGRHKARLVADGHLTDLPLNSVYAGVVSIRGMKMCIFIAELNDMEAFATDIGNAYLEATTSEKVCIRAGPEFKGLEGHLLVIYKALYGLRSSGKQFGDLLATCLTDIGFSPSKAEPQIFIRKDEEHNLYELIATYVDDLLIVSKKPGKILDTLTSDPYNFTLKGSGPLNFHLGCGFERDEDGYLCMNPTKYIDKMVQSYERMFGSTLGKKPHSPLEESDHPELDTSEFLSDDDTIKYQSLIGQLQWLITLGRWDIQTAVMSMSSFRAKPRKGHLERAKRICAYVNKFKHFKVKFRTQEPDLSRFDNATQRDWSKCVYEEFTEDIPTDAPPPLGKRITLIHWFDANLMHDVLSGKAVTGCIHFANKTPIMSYSKKQATTETATYGAEFCAARTCIEQIVDLRTTFRYLGVPIHEVSYMFGDNKSMIDSSTVPYARLHKRHNILSFHYVRSMIARGYIALNHVTSKSNLADVVSKHWSHSAVYNLLKPVFHHVGDTGELYKDDG